MTSGRLTLEHTGDDVVVAGFGGELDFVTCPTLREEVIDLIDHGARHVVLDLTAVTFCDSSGLSALISIWRRARSADGSLTLAAVPGRLQRLLNHTGVGRLMPAYPDATGALAAATADTFSSNGGNSAAR